jgi:hypothetical protein
VARISKINSEHVDYVVEIAIMTGKNAPVNTLEKWNVGGTDLGFPVYDDKRKTMYYYFGDTFSTTNQIGGDWRSQTVGIAKNLDLSKGVLFDTFICDENGHAKEIIPSQKKTNEDEIEVTRIVTGGIVIQGVHYIYFMSIYKWRGGLPWLVGYNGVAKSTDGQNYKVLNNVFFTADSIANTMAQIGVSFDEAKKRLCPNMAQVFPYYQEKDDYVYIFGIPGGRKGSMKVARYKKENIEDMNKYEYYVGGEFKAGFEALQEFSAAEDNFIAGPDIGEFSISYNKYLKKYVMTYLWSPLHPRISNGIFMRLSDDLMHWSEHEGILPFNFYYKTYAPLTHDLLETKDGKIKYMIVSQWISPREDDYGYNPKVMAIHFK